MHTIGESGGSGVPAFLAKLWRLVEDEGTNNLIYWNAEGTSFIIQNQAQFAREILPLNYKHNNMASFIRQLNMYGFHKITSLDGGGLKFDRDEMEFSHPCFRRDQPFLLEHIKRKISAGKTTTTDDKTSLKQEIVSKVLTDVKNMKGRQDSLDSRFMSMKQENEALWREVAILRQKHMKQQQIVNKLIQFLVTIVQPQRGSGISSMGGMGGVKRRYQLMINDVPEAAKVRKTGRTTSASSTNEGPIIRELTEELLDNYNDVDDEINSPYVVSPGFQQQSNANDYDDIENIAACEQLVDEAEMETQVNETPDDEYGNYTSDNIDDIPIILEDAGPSDNTSGSSRYVLNGIAEEVPVKVALDAAQLLNVHNTIPTSQPPAQKTIQTKPFIQFQKVQVQPTMSGAVGAQQIGGRKVIGLNNLPKKTVAAKVIPTTSTSIRTTQSALNAGATVNPTSSNILRGSMGKSLLRSGVDGSKFMSTTTNVPVATITPSVPTQNLPTTMPTSRNTSAAGNSYTNRNDFVDAEMPVNLFDDTETAEDDLLPNDLIDAGAHTMGGNIAETSASSSSNYNPGLSTAAGSNQPTNMTVAKYNNDLFTMNSPEQINQHLDTVQGDLDTLKEFLRNEDYTLDANALLGNPSGTSSKNHLYLSPSIESDFYTSMSKLFSDTDVFQGYGIPVNPTDSTTPATVRDANIERAAKQLQNQVSGAELMSYQPATTPIDFTEFLNIDEDSSLMSAVNEHNKAATSTSLETPNPLCESGDLATPYSKNENFEFPK